MKRIILLTSLAFIISCTSKNENAAIQELTNVYGGNITISNGASISTNQGRSKYKKITVNNSQAVEEALIEPELLASRHAITIFSKLEPLERDFDKLEVELNKSDGKKYTYEITRNKLEQIEKELQFVNNWIDKIKNNKIEEAYKYLKTPSEILPQFDQFKNTTEKLIEKFGPIESIWFDGYGIEQVNDSTFQGEMHQFIYDFKTKKRSYAMHIVVNPADLELKIYALSLDFD
jgi:hypothetical protein